MRTLRALTLAATWAAVCVLPALAGPEGDPDPCDPAASNCLLTPPQSVQVNPHPLHADGTADEVPASAGLSPVEVTIPMPAPAFVDPMPLGWEDGYWMEGSSAADDGTLSGIAGSDGGLLMGDAETGSSGVGGATAGAVGAAQALALAGLGAMGVVATASQGMSRLSSGLGSWSSSGRSGPGSAGRGARLGAYGRGGSAGGGGVARRDRENRLLPRATWMPGAGYAGGTATTAKKALFDLAPPPATPGPTETPTPPERTPIAGSTQTPSGGGITPVVTPTPQARGYRPGAVTGSGPGMPWNTLASKFAGMVRGFAQSEYRGSLISGTVSGVGSLARQGGIASVGVLSRAMHGQLPSLERAINNGVQAAGAVVDRAVARVDGALFSLANRVDDATSPMVGRINAWAAGEALPTGEGRGFLRGAWEGAVNRVRSAGAALLRPNSPRFDAKVSAVAGIGAGMSFVGNLVGARTGSQAWRDVGGVGDVISGAANLVGLRGAIANARIAMSPVGKTLVNGVSRFAGLANVAVKASGVLSAVTGVYTAVTEYQKVRADLRSNGGRLSETGKVAAVKAATGAAATLGGLLLLTPAAPVGGVILAVSGIASAGTWVYENRERLWNGLKAYQGVARNAATIASVVTKRAVTTVRQSSVGRAVQSAASAVSNAASSVRGFLGKVLGGGSQPSSPASRPASRLSPTTTPRPATSRPARPTPQPSRSTPSPGRSPSAPRSRPSPSRSPSPRSSPARSAPRARSPSRGVRR